MRIARHAFILVLYAHITHVLLVRSMVAHSIHIAIIYTERVMSQKRKIASGVAMRGDGGVAGEGRIVGVPNAPCH